MRYLMEELLPPALRDSTLFRLFARTVLGPISLEAAEFRRRAVDLTEQEYAELYRKALHIHDGTDNSEACIDRIGAELVGGSVLDVGCGLGYLLQRLKTARPEIERFVGVDFVIDNAKPSDGIEFKAARIENLPFPDGHFDTVCCTHVLEHVLDFRAALKELRRVAKRRLIVVVPREREGRYAFNPHFHFFPYRESFLRAIYPLPNPYICEDIGRDIYFREDVSYDAKNGG